MDSHTLIQALIYLGSAALIVPIAVRLGLGSVLGYLIAGCIIGPWGLRLVTDAEAILHFAEIGVVLMLFVIGLELDPQRLWKLRASVFGGGALQMVVCGVLIGLFCMLLGMRWQVAELIGMTLALSSTAIAMQAMNERNLTVSQMGRSAFAVLLFQDIAAIPLVAMIPLLAASGGSTTLAAFALPTLSRSVAALIDWFTLLFFTGIAIFVWVIWIAMQTGFPAKPAANVAKLAPGFEPSFSLVAFLVALAATLVWAWLVQWRAGRHRAAIWKSLVLPAGGAALGWLLLMTLWMPLLDFARSYAPQVSNVTRIIGLPHPECVEVYALNRGQITALQHHGNFTLQHAQPQAQCPWLVADESRTPRDTAIDAAQWTFVGKALRPADKNDNLLLYRRIKAPH